MNDTILTGIFALAGAMIGGVTACIAANIGHRRELALKHIRRLCEQVSAFYQLEQLYKDELAMVDPQGRSSKKILEEMRSKIEQSGEYERPEMTSVAADKIRRVWS